MRGQTDSSTLTGRVEEALRLATRSAHTPPPSTSKDKALVDPIQVVPSDALLAHICGPEMDVV